MVQNCWIANRCNQIDCDKSFCLKKFKLDTLFEKALLTEFHKKDIALRVDADQKDLDAFQYLKSIELNIETFVERGDNLYIHSATCGNGKSSWAVKLLKAFLFSIWHKSDLTCRAMFIHVPRFLLSIKDNISQKSDYVQYIKDNVFDADLVVFDEVGTKSLTNFEHEHILNIINTRLEMGKANIYTSNLSNEEMLDKMGERLFSRIIHNSNDVGLVGADKRGLFK